MKDKVLSRALSVALNASDQSHPDLETLLNFVILYYEAQKQLDIGIGRDLAVAMKDECERLHAFAQEHCDSCNDI